MEGVDLSDYATKNKELQQALLKGKVLRRLSSQVGVIKVTDVDDVSAIATVVSGTGFKVGDMVKTTTQ